MEISEKPRMFDLESVSIKQQIIATKLSNPIKQSKIITHPKKKIYTESKESDICYYSILWKQKLSKKCSEQLKLKSKESKFL